MKTDGVDASLYEAYSRAWEARVASSSTGEETLLASFAEHAPASEEDVRQLLVKAWNHDVPPSKLTSFVVKYTAEHARGAFKEIRDIVRQYPAWMELPAGLSKVSKGVLGSDADNVKRLDFVFRPALQTNDLLERCEPVEVNSKGFRKIPVWLDLTVDGDAGVLTGTEVIGSTSVPADLRGRIKAKRLGKRKVPDGSIQLRESDTGAVEFRKLRVYFPK